MTHVYTVSGLKTFTAMEGQGFNATLLRNDVKVALVINEGTGGPTYARWLDKGALVDGQYRTYEGGLETRRMTPEEAILNEVVIAQPAETVDWSDRPQPVIEEFFLDEVVEYALCERRLKRLMANKVVFVLDGKPMTMAPAKGSTMTLEQAAQRVATKHPTARILNTLPLDEAVSVASEAGI
jgi:hypothetical protein